MSRSTNGHRDDDAAAAIQAIDDMGEVELGQVRLIGDGSRDGNRSWDPKRGEPRQHISTVLGEAFYSSQRRKHKIYECLSQQPHPICNFAAIGLGGVCLLFLILFATSGRSRATNFQSTTTYVDDGSVSPEGVVHSNFGLAHDYRGRTRQAHARQGMVAADHGRCSDIGRDALQAGGTAVDAAVATALCQGVVNPQASGLGGGTIMLIKGKDGYEVIDGREVAPRLASVDMFKDNPQASVLGGLAVAVPLELKALSVAHARHGKLTWHELVAPAAELARNGFPAHPYLINTLTNPQIQKALMQRRDLRDIFYKKGWFSWRAPKLNETCCSRPALANLLDSIASKGPSALYHEHAKSLSEEIRAAGGLVTEEDLLETQPVIRPQVLKIKVWGLEISAPPPPSSAATLLTALQILAGYDTPLAFQGGLGTHRIVESLKHAFALRQRLGDPSMMCPGDAFMPPPEDFSTGAPAATHTMKSRKSPPMYEEEPSPQQATPGFAEQIPPMGEEGLPVEEKIPPSGEEVPDAGVEPLTSAEDLSDENTPASTWGEPAVPSLPEEGEAATLTPAETERLTEQAETFGASPAETEEGDYGEPATPAGPDAEAGTTLASPRQGGKAAGNNPFDTPGLLDAADAVQQGSFGQSEEPQETAPASEMGDYADEDQVGEEGQGSAQEEEGLNEDAVGFGRRRLRQWFGGANPAEFTPAETPQDAIPQGCFLNLKALLTDLVSPEFASQLRDTIQEDETGEGAGRYGGRWAPPAGTGEEPRDAGTTHISVVDKDQLAVSMTSTINLAFGSMLLSPSTGILLNNQMDDFSTPGRANTYGLHPSEANYIAPGKKPLSSMSPIIVQQADGQLRAVVGGSGGPRIMSAVLQTLVRLIALGEDPLTAVAAPRLHHQLLPNVVSAENWTAGSMPFIVAASEVEELEARGHRVNGSAWGGVVQAIVMDPFTQIMTGASDPRKDGAPSGF